MTSGLVAYVDGFVARDGAYVSCGDDTGCCQSPVSPCLVCKSGTTPKGFNVIIPENTCVFPPGTYQLLSRSCDAVGVRCSYSYLETYLEFADLRTRDGSYRFMDDPLVDGTYSARTRYRALHVVLGTFGGTLIVWLFVGQGPISIDDGFDSLGLDWEYWYTTDGWYTATQLDAIGLSNQPPCTNPSNFTYLPGPGCEFAPGIYGSSVPAPPETPPNYPAWWCNLYGGDPRFQSVLTFERGGTLSFPNGLPIITEDGNPVLDCSQILDISLYDVTDDPGLCPDIGTLQPVVTAVF